MSRYSIVPDIPTTTPGLGFGDYAEALARIISGTNPPQFTAGIYGRWGSGKSSLLMATKRLLEADPATLVVEFDAWRYQRSAQIVVPLLHGVQEAAKAQHEEGLARSIGRLLRAVGLSTSFRIPMIGTDLSLADVKAAWDEDGEMGAMLDDVFARPFDELRRLGQSLDGKRIVVMIDDLDRCTSENIVSVLESINTITDVPGFIFVLALDYDVLVAAVEQRYENINGHEFIEKIIQLPFRIPRIAADAVMLTELVPDFADMPHLADLSADLPTLIELGFENNPRQVKRFLNGFTLVSQILEARGLEVDQRLLASILAGEMRWPEEFLDLRTAVNAGDAEPLQPLRDSETASLRRFMDQVLPPDVEVPQLLAVLRLTSSVALQQPEEGPDDDVPIGKVSENEPIVRSGLVSRGFDRMTGRGNYYCDSVPNYRFKVAKLVVRLEERRPDLGVTDWHLIRSFRITSEVNEALSTAETLASTGVVELP